MEDRFKYRGLTLEKRIWVYGNLYFIDDKPYIYTNGVSYQVDKDTIGQCIGLKDKNGNLIYEGDIIKSTKYVINMPVVYSIIGTFFGLKYPTNADNKCSAEMPSSEELEIVGNCHENGDLLEKNNE